MNMITEGTPLPPSEHPADWDKWLNIPELPLYQCIALSLDIDPKCVKFVKETQPEGRYWFRESDDFNDRLIVAVNNIEKFSFSASHNKDPWFTVRLADFVVWAKSLEWTLPAPLNEFHDSNNRLASDKDVFAQLEKSPYWNRFITMLKGATKRFPEWQAGQRKVQKTGNMIEWLKTEFHANSREAEIMKNILSGLPEKIE